MGFSVRSGEGEKQCLLWGGGGADSVWDNLL